MSSTAYFGNEVLAAPRQSVLAVRLRNLLTIALMATIPLTQVVYFGAKSINMAASDLVLPFGALFLVWQLLQGRLRVPLLALLCLNVATIAASLAFNLDNVIASKGVGGLILEMVKISSLWILYYVLVNVIRTRSELRTAIKVWLIGAAIVSLIGVGGALSYQMTRVENDYSLMFRAQGTLGDANLYASYLASSFFLALFYRKLTQPAPKWVFGAMVIYLAGMFFSASRGSMLAFAVALGALGFIASSMRTRLIGAGVIVFLAAIVFAVPNKDELLQSNPFTSRLATATVSIGDDAAADRKRLWEGAVERFAHSPIVGIGHGYYRPIDQPDPSNTIPVHNTYLGLLCETGLLGFAVYALIFLLPSAGVFFSQNLGSARLMLLAALFVLALCGLTLSLENFRGAWTLIAIMDVYRRTECVA